MRQRPMTTTWWPRSFCTGLVVLTLLAAAGAPARAQGQPPPEKKKPGQAIEIRGQAPTPQVVTVRPREVPTYEPAALPNAVMASGAWPAVSSPYAIAPANQLAGQLPIDTTAAGLARGGARAGGVAVAAGAAGAEDAAGRAGRAAPTGASAAEIEAMRRELAMRRARLDSLEASLHQNEAMQSQLGPIPTGPRGVHMSAADSAAYAARLAEIESIRRELLFRKVRLDSLQREVNTLGKPRPAVKSDTTPSPLYPKPPRG